MERTFNIITFGKRPENLLIALREKRIGSSLTTFHEYISENAVLFLHCKGLIVGTAVPAGPYEYSDKTLWADKLYPHRYPIKVLKLLAAPVPLNDGYINVELKERFGTGWAYKFLFSPKPIPNDLGMNLLMKVESRRSVDADIFHEKISEILD